MYDCVTRLGEAAWLKYCMGRARLEEGVWPMGRNWPWFMEGAWPMGRARAWLVKGVWLEDEE